MRQDDIRYSSWVISLTSIIYGISFLFRLISPNQEIAMNLEYHYYVYTILYSMLIIFGIAKIIGLSFKHKLLRRTSIITLMFSWGFIWTASVIQLIRGNFNHQSILIIPIIALCAYLAIRGDYS